MIKNAYKNYNFYSLPEFFDFPFNCPDFFFPENFFTTITNKKKKKELCLSITKKHFKFFRIFQFSGQLFQFFFA
jgi:hypothetical protein